MCTSKLSKRRKITGTNSNGDVEPEISATQWYSRLNPRREQEWDWAPLWQGKLTEEVMKKKNLKWLERDENLLWPALDGVYLEYDT